MSGNTRKRLLGPLPSWRTTILLCLFLGASMAGCLGSPTDDASPQGADEAPSAGRATENASDAWRVVQNETGTIESGAGSGWSYAAWNGDGGEPYRVSVDEDADRLSLRLSAPRVNTSSPGAGHVLMYVETAGGEYRAPDGARLVPVGELPTREEPLVITPTPPPEVQTIEVEDPEPGVWKVKVGPNGPAVETTFHLTAIQEGSSGT